MNKLGDLWKVVHVDHILLCNIANQPYCHQRNFSVDFYVHKEISTWPVELFIKLIIFWEKPI